MNAEAPKIEEAPKEDNTRKARELLIQGKVYRGLAQIFAILGLGAAAFLYYNATKGDFHKFLEHPYMLVVMLIPFLPSIILSMKAKKADAGYMKLAGEKS